MIQSEKTNNLQILVLASISCIGASVRHGLGRHSALLTPEQGQNAIEFLWITFCVSPSAEALAKISISLMLIRITTSTRWRLFLYFLIVLKALITATCLLVLLLSCTPIQLLWGVPVAGHCNTVLRTVFVYIQGGMLKSLFPTTQ